MAAEGGTDDFLREIDELLGEEGGEKVNGGGEGGEEKAAVLDEPKTAYA